MLAKLKALIMAHKTKWLGASAIVAVWSHDHFNEVSDLFAQHPKLHSALGYLFGVTAVVLGYLNTHRDDPPA